ncbi:MAG: PAS-domain containing protein [Proteobacteria bacterium]|nr:PAS-domain containing protein [Pseudomonadota bacterium]
MILSKLALLLIGLLLAGWTTAALYAIAGARARVARAEAGLARARRLGRMIDDSPALPLLVRADGKIEAPPRLAGWLGLDAVPQFLTELGGGDRPVGLEAGQLSDLSEAVRRTQKTAQPFQLYLTPQGSQRTLAARGHLADPQVSPGGAALVWLFDFTDAAEQLGRLDEEARRAREDFGALVGLIEAAPLPMWFRRPDGALQLVNSAYVTAVGGDSAAAVVAAGTELLEAHDGQEPGEVAAEALRQRRPVERTVSATIGGQRRAMRVSDLPLGADGIAGYAVDIEDREELARTLRAFREAQRSMLDQMSAGIAQFDAKRQLTFANQPLQRIFALQPLAMLNPPPFERFLDLARDAARLPEVRDFPAWRRERLGWFTAGAPVEEAWPLADGTHLRVVAQPLPDGGLLLIAEDRTEELRLSAMRDTLLRTRTATFDSLFEAVAVFAPDGRMQLWNRRFASAWGLENEFLDTHPRIDTLLEKVEQQLARPAHARAVGDVVRAATLQRQQTGGRVALRDGRWLEFAGVPLPDGNGLLTVLDITDSQKAEDALKERNAALVEADSLKTRFLASMSYEFRTPLTSIGGFAELLEAGLGGDLNPSGHEYIAAILTSVARLTEQIESLLDLSQSEAGMLPLASETIELMPFLKRLAEDRAAQLKEAGVTLDLRGNKGAGSITGDPRRLGRALGHLIDNAVRATPAGGRVRVEVMRHRRRGRDWARVVISDKGAGMSPTELARALGGLKAGGEGAGADRRQGLGLPLARQLIEAHRGHFELISEPGQGTVAMVDLP